jgi:hypothetical protein
MPSLPSLLFPLSFVYSLSLAASLHDNSQSCNCYTLDSEADKSYFLYHRFYDFRNLATKAGQYTTAPPLIEANQRWGKEPVRDSDVLNTTRWTDDWGIQDWGKKSDADAPVDMQNSPANVYISKQRPIALPFVSQLTCFRPIEHVLGQLNTTDISDTANNAVADVPVDIGNRKRAEKLTARIASIPRSSSRRPGRCGRSLHILRRHK